MFKSRQFIIGVIISVIFLAWALSSVDVHKVGNALLSADYWALVPALVLYFTGVWVRAVRWRVLLRPILPRTGLWKTFEVVVIGYMANDVLPARIGELVRSYVLSKREGVRKTATLATIFVERIFDGLTMIGFAAAVIAFVLIWDREALSTGSGHRLGTLLTTYDVPIGISALIFLALLVVFIVVASSRARVERLVSVALRLLPGRLHERAERLAASFIDGLGSLRSATSMGMVFGLSVLAWLFEAGMYYVLGTVGFHLVGGDGELLPFYAYMLATAFANLSTLLPQAPGYIGVFHAIALVVLAGAFGVNNNEAASYVLVLHAALVLPITLLGFLYLWRESLSWRELTGLEETRAEAAVQAHELEGPLTDIELVQEGKIGDSPAEADTVLEQAGEASRISTGGR